MNKGVHACLKHHDTEALMASIKHRALGAKHDVVDRKILAFGHYMCTI